MHCSLFLFFILNQKVEHSFTNIRLYDWEDYGKEMLGCCGYQIPDHILDFIDLERYGKYCGEEYLQEYSEGLIEIQ